MAAKVVVFGVIFVIMICLTVYMVEIFVPLSAKSELNICCRSTLLKMEVNGGLTDSERSELNQKLENKGFESISITGTSNAKQGEVINLRVEADYRYSKLTGLFDRNSITQQMAYDKTSIARRVTN